MANVDEIISQAIDHARGMVIKGITQIDTNKLPAEQIDALLKGVHDLRDTHNPLSKGYKELFECITWGETSDAAKAVVDAFFEYENEINRIQKYSIGNCHELAMITFDYLCHVDEPAIKNVELFVTEPGDHTFCVVNRNDNTTDRLPFKWGYEAKIVDAWGNTSFPAIQYLTKLKCFYDVDGMNYTRDFDSAIDVIGKAGVENFEYSKPLILRVEGFTKSLLEDSFSSIKDKIKWYILILQEYERDFDYLSMHMKGANSHQKKEVQEKLDYLNKAIVSLEANVSELANVYHDLKKLPVRQVMEKIITILQDSRFIFNDANKFITKKQHTQPDLLSKVSSLFSQSAAQKEAEVDNQIKGIINIIADDLRRNFGK